MNQPIPKGRLEICQYCNTILFYYGNDLKTKCLCRRKKQMIELKLDIRRASLAEIKVAQKSQPDEDWCGAYCVHESGVKYTIIQKTSMKSLLENIRKQNGEL